MILVTGGTGLVGSHLLQALAAEGKPVRAIKRPSGDTDMIRRVFKLYSKEPEKDFSQIEWVEADLMDIFSLEEAMEGVEEVYHCAALVSFLPGDRKKLFVTILKERPTWSMPRWKRKSGSFAMFRL